MMDTRPIELIAKITRAKTDKRTLAGLLTDYLPFIKKTVAGVFYKRERRQDNLTEAMLAFTRSVKTYEEKKGSFIAYARIVIKNRLIDAARKESKTRRRLFFISEKDERARGAWEADVARRDYDLMEEQNNLRMEIDEIKSLFEDWDFTWEKLMKNCPKRERSRRTCHTIARRVLEDEQLTAEMLRTRRLPAGRLSAKTGFSLKILEKYRQYIAAVVLIMRGDYPTCMHFCRVSLIRRRKHERRCRAAWREKKYCYV
jgi:RNA polymerase sigma factor